MYLANNDIVPDFFIVGAPKAGTTALDAYLRENPGVFMCRKEAHYFCSDFPSNVNYESFDAYRAIFSDASVHQLVGESSVWYLYSEVAVKKILALNPHAKFIAMLRDPVKAAHATHGELLLDLREDEPDFEKAWRLQDKRRSGERIPLSSREPKHLLYKDVCSWSHQVERLLETAPRENVKIIIMEEFFEDPDRGFRDVLNFLGIENIGLPEYPRVNSSKRVRHMWLLRAVKELPKKRPAVYRLGKRITDACGFHPGRIAYRYATENNIDEKPRRELSSRFKDELAEEFMPDVRRLEQVLNRSLTHYWFNR